MPHKRNPILTERLTGFARLLRGNAHTAMENVALWHERDISHSSIERVIFPDSTTIVDYMLTKSTKLMNNLLIYPENMQKNIDLTNGLIFSQEVLLLLIKKGLTREKAYELVQRNAMKVWKEKIDFNTLLKSDKEIMENIEEKELDKLFDISKILININKVYERLGL